MKIKSTEAQVKKAITDFLTFQENLGLCYFVRNNSFCGKLADKFGKLRWVKQGKEGSPDIILLLKGGLWVGIETKSSVGKQSPEQKAAQAFIEKLGGKYILARDIKEVVNLF